MPEAEKIQTIAAKYLQLFIDNGFSPRPNPEGHGSLNQEERLGHTANLLKEVPVYISEQRVETAKGVLAFGMGVAFGMGFCTQQEMQTDVKILEDG